MLEGFDKRVY